MKIPKICYKFAIIIVRKVQALLGFKTLGPRAIILNVTNQVLLVKHTYQTDWYLPGGGAKRGESVIVALLRELKEEVGVILTEEPQLFGIYFHNNLGVSDYPIIFVIKDYHFVTANSPEIEQIAWYDYSALPEMISPGTKRRLDEYFANTIKSQYW